MPHSSDGSGHSTAAHGDHEEPTSPSKMSSRPSFSVRVQKSIAAKLARPFVVKRVVDDDIAQLMEALCRVGRHWAEGRRGGDKNGGEHVKRMLRSSLEVTAKIGVLNYNGLLDVDDHALLERYYVKLAAFGAQLCEIDWRLAGDDGHLGRRSSRLTPFERHRIAHTVRELWSTLNPLLLKHFSERTYDKLHAIVLFCQEGQFWDDICKRDLPYYDEWQEVLVVLRRALEHGALAWSTADMAAAGGTSSLPQ